MGWDGSGMGCGRSDVAWGGMEARRDEVGLELGLGWGGVRWGEDRMVPHPTGPEFRLDHVDTR